MTTNIAMNNLRNLGPKSAQMLAGIGLESVEEQRERGSIDTFFKLKFSYPGEVSLNFLWAIEAGLQDRDWRNLTNEEKQSLKDRLALVSKAS